MNALQRLFPDIEVLLTLAPEELAVSLLQLVKGSPQGQFYPDSATTMTTGYGMAATVESAYPPHRSPEVERVVAEGWQWLLVNLLILPAPGINGRNGHMILSRRGAELANNPAKFEQFRQAAAFPKSLLHPSIADKVWLALARGELADAVFVAFRAVEEAVRAAAKCSPTDVGVDLMRKAFDKKKGPLRDPSQPEPERDALAHLFAGAMGSYKNPHSHRTVSITDAREAQEMVLLASHLLRIVEARAKLLP